MILSKMQQHYKWLLRGMWAAAVLGFVFEHFDLGRLAAGTFLLLLFHFYCIKALIIQSQATMDCTRGRSFSSASKPVSS